MIGHCLIAIRGSAQNVETENDDTLGYKRPDETAAVASRFLDRK
jgi:hypothetical protein